MSLRAGYRHISLILSPAEPSSEHKYLKLILKVDISKEPAGFIDEPDKVFLSYISLVKSGQDFIHFSLKLDLLQVYAFWCQRG